jgi:DNA-binding MarR family transcriptional regulator
MYLSCKTNNYQMPKQVASPPVADGRLAWYRLLQVSRLVLRELDRRLDEEHRTGVNEFDVLITLDNAADRRLRMTDLAEAVMLSSGGLTRLVGRLESRGLLERVQDSSDLRGFYATLTSAGSEHLARARVTHDAVIEELIGSKLSNQQVASLARELGRVAG